VLNSQAGKRTPYTLPILAPKIYHSLDKQDIITVLVLYSVQGLISDVVFDWSCNKATEFSNLIKTSPTEIRLTLILFI
jgi:hypothetical protein